MVLLGGLELLAAGYLIDRHQKNKKEERRIREEEEDLEEERYRIEQARRRRSRSRDRKDHHRRHSHERRDSRERRSSHKYKYEQDRPPRHHSASVPPPPPAPAAYAPPPARPVTPAAYAPPPPQAAAPGIVTGWPSHWAQSSRPEPATPSQSNLHPYPQQQPLPQSQMPAHLSPYYRDPANPDMKYGFQDSDTEGRDRQDGRRGRRRQSSSGDAPRVRFNVSDRPQPGDEPPPEYRP